MEPQKLTASNGTSRTVKRRLSERETEVANSTDHNLATNTKRNKKTISNFSIESIMKSSGQQQQRLEESNNGLESKNLLGSISNQLTSEEDSKEAPMSSPVGKEASSPVSPAPSSFSGNSSEVELSSCSEDTSNGDELIQQASLASSGGADALKNGPSCNLKNASNKRHSNASSNHLLRQQVCHDPRLKNFECQLDNLDLWHRFHPLDTEMIITKQGRRMFPPVRVTFSLASEQPLPGGRGPSGASLQPQQQQPQTHSGQTLQLNNRDKYQVLMDILPYDNKRYRYAYHKSSWQQAGKADPPSPTKLFLHPDGPFTLEQLKRQVISFEKIKLTNNDANKHGFIVLNSMHKYQPRIHLVLWRGKESQNLANAPISQLEQETYKTFIFSETIFTAVTAYQNHSITKLKIDSNPFAKGFRDSSRLTDLELESMQDLMSEAQCPFSPPRVPNHAFPQFLFAQANSSGNPLGGEDPSSALLRERTFMEVASFIQQQQHQAGSQQHRSPMGGGQAQQELASSDTRQSPQAGQQQAAAFAQPLSHFLGSLGGLPGAPGAPTSGPPSGQQPGPNLQQLIAQQELLASFVAAGGYHPAGLFGLGSSLLGPQHAPPPPPYNIATLNYPPPASQHPPAGKLLHENSANSPASGCQLSPTGSSGAKEPQVSLLRRFNSSPQGAATHLYQRQPELLMGNHSSNAQVGATVLHQKHLEALMQLPRHQQMSLGAREDRDARL